MSKSKEIAEQLKQFAPWYGGEVERLMQEAAAHILAQEAEIELLKGYRSRALELATAYNNAQENVEQISAHREHILASNDKLRAERDQARDELISYKVMYERTSDAAKDLSHQLNQARNALRVCVEAMNGLLDNTSRDSCPAEVIEFAERATRQAKEAL